MWEILRYLIEFLDSKYMTRHTYTIENNIAKISGFLSNRFCAQSGRFSCSKTLISGNPLRLISLFARSNSLCARPTPLFFPVFPSFGDPLLCLRSIDHLSPKLSLRALRLQILIQRSRVWAGKKGHPSVLGHVIIGLFWPLPRANWRPCDPCASQILLHRFT